MVRVVSEEVDVIGKTPLNPKLLDGRLNLANVMSFLGKDADHDRIRVGGGLLTYYRQYF